MNKRDLPLDALQAAKRVKQQMLAIYDTTSDIIDRVDDDKYILQFFDKEDSKFFFRISYPYRPTPNNNILFKLGWCPGTRSRVVDATVDVEENGTLNLFNDWVAIIKEYAETHLEEADAFAKIYAEEFYSEFEIVDVDADTHPYEHAKQLLLLGFLERVEEKLEKVEEKSPELMAAIAETKALKNNIQNLTKRKFVQGLSKVYGRVKKYSLTVAKEIFAAAQKELIKRLVEGRLDDLSEIPRLLGFGS